MSFMGPIIIQFGIKTFGIQYFTSKCFGAENDHLPCNKVFPEPIGNRV